MEIDRNIRVKLDLDYIDASLVMEALNWWMDHLVENPSIENILKYTVISGIGKKIVDQVIPQDQQESIKREFENDLLQALKKEKGV